MNVKEIPLNKSVRCNRPEMNVVETSTDFDHDDANRRERRIVILSYPIS